MNIIPTRLIVASALVIVLSLGSRPAAAADFFVSTTGNDAWSGTTANANAEKTDGPFATLERARDAVRKLRASGSKTESMTIHVRGGLYELSRTLRIGPEDSGAIGAPLVIRNYQDERPVLVGGRKITEFVPHQGSILKADLGRQGWKSPAFRQLVFDGRRQHLARYPNFDPENPYGGGWAYADGTPVPIYVDIPGESKRSFQVKPGDLRRSYAPGSAEILVFPRYNWWNNIVRIAAFDASNRTLTLDTDASYGIRPGDRYFVRNVLEELDAPGEWYLDAAKSTLYFWPPAPLKDRAVVAPTLRTIIDFAPGAHHITVRGFTLECAEGTAVTLTRTSECRISGNTIRNVGDYSGSGISVNGGVGNGVVGNDISEVGSHGITISGGDRKTLTGADNFADNNYIHHVGVFYKQGVGISLDGVGNRASHNLIHDTPRMGIMFSGNNLLIELNHIRHVNLETEDTGAVYTGGRDWISSRGSVIRHNYFHDILGYGKENNRWVSPHFAWGVYLDDNTGGVDVIGNVVVRASRAGIHLHNGRDNRIENNIFVDNGPQQIEYSGWTTSLRYWKDHFPTMEKGYALITGQPAWKGMRNIEISPARAPLPDGLLMTGNEFYRNIVSYRDPKAKLFAFRNLPLDYYHSDQNLVYHFGQPIATGYTAAGKTLSANLVANPGFEDGTPGSLPKSWVWQIRPSDPGRSGLSEETFASGKRSLRLDGGEGRDSKGNPQFPVVTTTEIPAKPGHSYRLAANLKASSVGAEAALVGQSHIANVYFWAKPARLKVGTEWKRYEMIFRLPDVGEPGYHARMKTLRGRVDFPAKSGSLWVDDVVLEEVEAISEWQAWQQLGFDGRSLVADPRFVAPDRDDYRLRPDSPAFTLGFQAIPFEKIGPYADPLRASWPIVEAEGARERPLNPGDRPTTQ